MWKEAGAIILHAYLLFHCAKLWVEGLEVVSKTALSVHSSLEVSQCHLTQPIRAHSQSCADLLTHILGFSRINIYPEKSKATEASIYRSGHAWIQPCALRLSALNSNSNLLKNHACYSEGTNTYTVLYIQHVVLLFSPFWDVNKKRSKWAISEV